MKKIITLSAALLLMIFVFAYSGRTAATEEEPSVELKMNYRLPLSEKLVFKIKVMGLSIATQTNTTRGIVDRNGRPAVNIYSHVKTHKWVMMYGIDNSMESFLDAESMKPLYYEERAKEKDWAAIETVTFLNDRMKYSAKKGLKLDRMEETEHEYPTKQWPQDELSMTYYVRHLPLKVGKTFTMYACVDSGLVTGTVKVVKKMRIKTIHGKKDVFLVTSTIGDSKFHIGVDEKRIPYRFEVKLNSGIAKGTLTNYSDE